MISLSASAHRRITSPGADNEQLEYVKAKWEPFIQKLEQRNRETPPPKDPILLVGSSTFTYWKNAAEDLKPLPVLNQGFGGSDMLAILAFYDRLVRPICSRTIVLYVGGNDILQGVKPETFMERVNTFIERVNNDLPNTKLAILSLQLKPCFPDTDPVRKVINNLLVERCQTAKNVQYVDITTPTLKDGKPRTELFGADQLHFNEAGYKVLAHTIRPVLQLVHNRPCLDRQKAS